MHPFSGIIVRYKQLDTESIKEKIPSEVASPIAASPAAAKNKDDTPKENFKEVTEADIPNLEDVDTASSPAAHTDARLVPNSGRSSGEEDEPIPVRFDDELHVNLWEIDDSPFLDVGVKIKDWQQVDEVEIVLPWKVDEEDVQDLCGRLDRPKSVAAVFNEIVRYDGRADSSFANIYFLDDTPGKRTNSPRDGGVEKPDLVLVKSDLKCFKIETTRTSDAAVMSIVRVKFRRPEEHLDAAIYLRFRINNVPRTVYQATFDRPDKNILSSYVEARIIEFRINVRRGLPDELLMDSAKFPPFKKIHFFLTIDRADECVFEGQNFIGCRSLMEEDMWDEYVKRENASISPQHSVKNFLGYQWTKAIDRKEPKNKPVKDLVALGRFTKTSSNVLQLLRFLGFGLIFGMAGSGAWDVLTNDWTWAKFFSSSKPLVELGAIAFGLLLVFSKTLLKGKRHFKNKS